LSAFEILYPQYWLQDGVEEAFPKHLQVLKSSTRSQHAHGSWDLPKLTYEELLFASALDIQQSLYRVTMKAQAKGCICPSLIRTHLPGFGTLCLARLPLQK
jgi:hypothetical protein